jgi:hypothetical protein
MRFVPRSAPPLPSGIGGTLSLSEFTKANTGHRYGINRFFSPLFFAPESILW